MHLRHNKDLITLTSNCDLYLVLCTMHASKARKVNILNTLEYLVERTNKYYEGTVSLCNLKHYKGK